MLPDTTIYPSSTLFCACVPSSLMRIIDTKNSLSVSWLTVIQNSNFRYTVLFKSFLQKIFSTSICKSNLYGSVFFFFLFNSLDLRVFYLPWRISKCIHLPLLCVSALCSMLHGREELYSLFDLSVTEISRLYLKFNNCIKLYLPIY